MSCVEAARAVPGWPRGDSRVASRVASPRRRAWSRRRPARHARRRATRRERVTDRTRRSTSGCPMCASAVRVPADSAIPIAAIPPTARARRAFRPRPGLPGPGGGRFSIEPERYRSGAKTDDKRVEHADRRMAPTRVLRYSPTLARGNHSAVDLDSAPETCAARTRLREPYVRTSRMRYAATRIVTRGATVHASEAVAARAQGSRVLTVPLWAAVPRPPHACL